MNRKLIERAKSFTNNSLDIEACNIINLLIDEIQCQDDEIINIIRINKDDVLELKEQIRDLNCEIRDFKYRY